MKKDALKKLEGTDRQITFANDIREYVLYQLEHSDDQESAILVAKAVKRTKKAKWIIDTFVKSYYDKTVLGHVKAMFLEDPKLSEAKQLKQSDFKYNFNDSTYLNHDKLDDKKKVSEVKDVAFNNPDAREHQEIASGIKKVKKYLSYQDSNIKSGYYSISCDLKIVESIKSLQKLGQNVSEYKERYSKQEPYYYIYRAKDYLSYQDGNIKSGYYSISCDLKIVESIKSLQKLGQNVSEYKERYSKQEPYYYIYRAKDYLGYQDQNIESGYYSDKCDKVITSMIDNLKELKQDTANLESRYLKQKADKAKLEAEKKKHQQMYQKASKALDSFIEKFKVPTNYLSKEDFQRKLEDLFEKAKTIYEDDSFGYNHDYLALNKNDFFIADYNGLDGDDWGQNNSGSYIVFHVKLTNEQVKEIKRLIIDFEKAKD